LTHLEEKIVLKVKVLFLFDLLANLFVLILFFDFIKDDSMIVMIGNSFLLMSCLLFFNLQIKALFHILIKFLEIFPLLLKKLFLIELPLMLMLADFTVD
jgi:hypothetical protein